MALGAHGPLGQLRIWHPWDLWDLETLGPWTPKGLGDLCGLRTHWHLGPGPSGPVYLTSFNKVYEVEPPDRAPRNIHVAYCRLYKILCDFLTKPSHMVELFCFLFVRLNKRKKIKHMPKLAQDMQLSIPKRWCRLANLKNITCSSILAFVYKHSWKF